MSISKKVGKLKPKVYLEMPDICPRCGGTDLWLGTLGQTPGVVRCKACEFILGMVAMRFPLVIGGEV